MKKAGEIVDLIKSSKKIVITSHRSPDGDSIGSSLGLFRFIQKMGIDADVCHPDPAPNFLKWVSKGVNIINFQESKEEVKEKLLSADLIFCLDYNDPFRIGREMGELLIESKAKKIMIDHHPNPSDFVDISVSEPSVCSTAQLIYELIDSSGNLDLLDSVIGTPVYLGIMTDTGSFRYSNVTSRTHVVISELLRSGVNQSLVHESTFDNMPINRLKLRGYAMSEKIELLVNYPIAIMSLNEEELKRFSYIKGDTEGLVNIALAVEGVEMAAFFVEKDGVVKISFRSKGDLVVNELASDNFEGGGHVNAAGGISRIGLAETIEKFKNALPKYYS